MASKFKQGDTVIYDHLEYVVTGFDEINEELVIEAVDGDEEVSIDESLLLSVEEYQNLLEQSSNESDPDPEDEDEDDVEDEDEELDEGKIGDKISQAIWGRPDAFHGIDTDLRKLTPKGRRERDKKDLKMQNAMADAERKKHPERYVGEDSELNLDEYSFDEDEDFELEEETAAARTIKAHPSAAMDSAKSKMISDTIQTMSSMSRSDMVDFFNKSIAQIGKEAEHIPGGAASSNKNTIKAKPSDAKATVKEDLAEILGSDEGLSEELQTKIATLFEAAVHLRATDIETKLVEQYEYALEEEVLNISEELSEQVDRYLSFVAEEWVKENELVIESNLKTEFTESFMHGLKTLFEEHYADIPESEVDVVEALAEKVEELEDSLNEQLEANIALTEALEGYNAEEIFSEVAEGLAMTQVEKLRTLAESVEFDGDEDEYRSKIETIKKHHFRVSSPESTLNEEVEIFENEESKPNSGLINPNVARYADAISRTTKK